jgi:hypothetical protein
MDVDTEVQPAHTYTRHEIVRAIVFWLTAPIIIPAMLIVWYGDLALFFQLPGREYAYQATIFFCDWLFRLAALTSTR